MNRAPPSSELPYRIHSLTSAAGNLSVPVGGDGLDLQSWLSSQAALTPSPAWALVYLDQAVTWGTLSAGVLHADPALRGGLSLARLLDARVFDPTGEVRLWRDPAGELRARWRRDDPGAGGAARVADEVWYLWGNRIEPTGDGWARVFEQRGAALRFPIVLDQGDLPLRLVVRHYLAVDDLGMPCFRETRFVHLARADGTLVDPPTGPPQQETR